MRTAGGIISKTKKWVVLRPNNSLRTLEKILEKLMKQDEQLEEYEYTEANDLLT